MIYEKFQAKNYGFGKLYWRLPENSDGLVCPFDLAKNILNIHPPLNAYKLRNITDA